MELEKMGLRTASYPFDWVVSDRIEIILALISNGFQKWLDIETLYQENLPSHYYCPNTGVHFFHDFSAYKPLASQIESVRTKYDRRINRFYRDIVTPTLFIRYCQTEEEVYYVLKNCNEIKLLLKSFNCDNDILFVVPNAGGGQNFFDKDNLFAYVRRMKNGKVERHWINEIPGLRSFLYNSISLKWYQILKNLMIHYRSVLMKRIRKKTMPQGGFYRHDRQSDTLAI